MATPIVANTQVDYKLEAQILEEVTDLVQTVKLHYTSDGFTGLSSIRRCIEIRRNRMSTTVGRRIARDLVKSKNPIRDMQTIVDRYLPNA